MVFEMAQMEIKPGMESAFEHGVAQAVPLFQRARGCHGLRLLKWIEQSSRYTLMVTWETVAHHEVHFRQSEDYKEWRRLVGECFASKSQVIHTEVAVAEFRSHSHTTALLFLSAEIPKVKSRYAAFHGSV